MNAHIFSWSGFAFVAALSTGCLRPLPSDTGSGVTDRMRAACPILTEEVLEAFVLAVSDLRDDGLSESDALMLWVDGCENIPPDGNFQGDIPACETCMPAIVADVYLGL